MNRNSKRFSLVLLGMLGIVTLWLFASLYQAASTTTGSTVRLAGPGAGDALIVQGGTPSPGVIGPIIGDLVVAGSFDGDLRDLPETKPVQHVPRPEFESPFEREGQVPFEGPDPVVQDWQGTLAMPAPIQNFAGLNFVSNGAGHPPDTNGDVGPNHYIQTVNTSIGIYSKTGTQLAAFTFDFFFAGSPVTGTPCDENNNGDPVVLYDPYSDRWIITDFAWSDTMNGPYYECIAVSKTADPVSGGWWLYALRADDASHPWLNDYPKLGVWPDGIYMSANMFDCPNSLCSSASYQGVRVWALNRDDLISGAALRTVIFDLGATSFSLLPSNVRGDSPPAGAPNYFLAISAALSGNTVSLWKFHVDWVTQANSTFTGPTNLTVATYSNPAFADRVPQQSPGEALDDLSGRLMMQLQYRNIGGTESLWVNHTVSSGGVTGIRWYEIRSPNGTPSVFQQSTFQPDSTYRWMGSLAVDQDGNMALGYSASGSSAFPSIRYAGRLITDTINTLPQSETTLIAGTGAQTGGGNRWGDYSAMTVDPVDDCTFWYTTEYYAATGSNWQTRIGSFKFPSCGTAGPTPTPTRTRTPTVTGTPPTSTPTPTGNPKSYLPFVRKPAAATPTPTATPPAGSILAGLWESMTGDEFYVTTDLAFVDDFAIFVDVTGCGSYKITHTTAEPISNSEFSFSGAFYASGTFTSDTTASGTDGLTNFFISGCGFVSGGPWLWDAAWVDGSQPAFYSAFVVAPETAVPAIPDPSYRVVQIH